MPAAEVLARVQDMTIAREEFLRSLPAAVAGAAFVVEGGEVRPVEPGQGWRIRLEPLPELRLGALRLARHRVTIFLAGRDAAATQRFLDRFELYFRRGGG